MFCYDFIFIFNKSQFSIMVKEFPIWTDFAKNVKKDLAGFEKSNIF